jgi:hypothetical protein
VPRSNVKTKVIDRYDRVSPYYRSQGGRRHHGYWIRGDETKEKAQLQLIEHLAETANATDHFGNWSRKMAASLLRT